jgi:hypothetical protein
MRAAGEKDLTERGGAYKRCKTASRKQKKNGLFHGDLKFHSN